MSKYRKKPVVIDAARWDGFEHDGSGDPRVSPWTMTADPTVHGDKPFTRRPACRARMDDHGCIDTIEGDHLVCPGDWIITGVQGEAYACEPDIFAETYEQVPE